MNSQPDSDAQLARYDRQMRIPAIGVTGQKRIKYSQVTIIGVGALGSAAADMLVRAGIGHVRLVDRDYVELNNLQRQVLFDEHDIAQNLPKAEAAARKLRKINSACEVEPLVADANAGNIAELIGNADLLLDGTDNLATRYLLNDIALKLDIPWVYAACVATEARVLPIIPHETACLRCVFPEPPPVGSLETCDTAGILAPAVQVAAALQVAEALKLLTGNVDALIRKLVAVDVWTGVRQALDVQSAFAAGDCPACHGGRYDFLAQVPGAGVTTLCGRDAVQLFPAAPPERPLDFQRLATRIGASSRPAFNAFLLRFHADRCDVTVFPDGRAIIKGTTEPAVARKIYDKYIGG